MIFVVVWLTGYEGVDERTNQLTIGIVNEDVVIGKEMTKQIEAKDLFQVVQFDELSKAKKELDERKISMLIYFPDQLTEQLQANQPVEINYYINQSAPILVKRMMETLANSMNIEFNQQAKEINHVKLAKRIPKIVAAEAPNEEMAIKLERITSQMIEMIEKSTQFVPIKANVMKLNEQEGFVNNLLPLLIVLASYISAMLISQYLQLTNGKLITTYNRFTLFIVRQIINSFLAISISLLTVCLMYLFQIELDQHFFALWGIQTLLLFSFIVLSQIFVMLFGNPGMLFNIALTAIQLVSSGALVPRELLSTFYYELGKVLPATYGVNSYFSLIYGGGNIHSDLKNLSVIVAVLLGIAIAIQIVFYLWDKYKSLKKPVVEY